MADGWARATGGVGVVTATSGPGTSQLATSMIVASRARTPLVAFCGETPLGDESAVQYLDQRRFAAAIECEFFQVAKADSATEVVRNAFHLARTQSRPVMISAPIDVQLQEFDDDLPYSPSTELLRTPKLLPHPERIEQ